MVEGLAHGRVAGVGVTGRDDDAGAERTERGAIRAGWASKSDEAAPS